MKRSFVVYVALGFLLVAGCFGGCERRHERRQERREDRRERRSELDGRVLAPIADATMASAGRGENWLIVAIPGSAERT